ncbi:LysR family transcriptional regulator [Azospirillum doebereinerae]|uniref:LysR family transcriptional regulator n=1 Tax=Azospirillum doebereinerae TaxID=92933 RepID=A0A3S0V342_9PROT|nr:LysR family transcriptional regulator [Azospirillum doebereinerae]MCG5238628.1 LysR family transcriptional regulator [Azospirillum doebereinerae]RUQ61850.1 LysR family transcriptional regulator [Azospirillum doebereinerae]
MDTETARSFLEVVAAGSFVAAAERLHVTQSTVSTRIRQLEEQLGCRLFLRTKSGTTLTAEGLRFQRHAIAILRLWEQARQEAALPPGHRALLRIGGEAGLWNRLLHRWIPWMRRNAADIALRCEVGLPDGLLQGLREGTLDLGVMYSPRSTPGLTVSLLIEEELVLLRIPGESGGGDYVHIDWSDDFRRKIRLRHPEAQTTPLSIGVGTLGLDYLKQCGGTGHFPRGLVQPLVDAGIAEILPEAHPFNLPIYAVHPVEADADVVDAALTGLRRILSGDPETAPSSDLPMASIE